MALSHWIYKLLGIATLLALLLSPDQPPARSEASVLPTDESLSRSNFVRPGSDDPGQQRGSFGFALGRTSPQDRSGDPLKANLDLLSPLQPAIQPTAPSILSEDQQPTAPGCSSPQWDLDSGGGVNLHCWNNVYVVSVDLRNPEVEVQPAEVNRPNALSSVADGETIAVINGDYTDYTCGGTRCAQGLFYIDGNDKTNRDKLCSDALKRRVLALSADGRPLIDWWYALVDNPQSICSNLVEGGGWATSYRHHVISGGPQITFDGAFRWNTGSCVGDDYVINDEHFKCDAANWWNRNGTFVGYTSDGNRLLFAVTNGVVSPRGVHDVLWQVAQHHGQALKATLRYDGGSVSGLYYRRNTTYSINPNVPVANAWVVRRRTVPPTPPPSDCNPNADQVALFVDADYRGQCVVKGVGEYSNPGALGLPNDSISSVKVGSNVKAILCEHDNYGGSCEEFTGDDSNLTDNSIGNDRVSSVKVEQRASACPQSGGVILYKHANYDCGGEGENNGYVQRTNPGDYDIGSLGINDQASSIRMPSGWSVRLYRDGGFGGPSVCFNGDDNDFSNNTYEAGGGLNDSASSFRAYSNSDCGAPPTSTPTRTPTPTPTSTPTPIPTSTSTPTGTPTSTRTPTSTSTSTSTPTPTSTLTVTPTETNSPLPDLVVSHMTIELETGGACNYSSTALGVRVWIENIGNADAGPFVVDVNGSQQTVSSGLIANQTTSLWFSGYVSFGENTAFADATFQITESNEDNNQLSQMLPIPTLPPTCTPTATSTPTPTHTPTPTATSTATPSGSRLHLDPISTSTTVTQTFTVDIMAETGTSSADTVDAYLDFNPAYLKVVDLEPAEVFSFVTLNSFNNEKGEINFSATTLDNPLTGDFTAATIRFRAKAIVDTTDVLFVRSGARISELYQSGEALNATLENGSVSITSSVELNGRAALERRGEPGDPRWVTELFRIDGDAITCNVRVYEAGSTDPLATFCATTDAYGRFSVELAGLEPGTYDISVKGAATLSNKRSSASLPSALRQAQDVATEIDFGTLCVGDSNGDDRVNGADVSYMVPSFLKCRDDEGYRPYADTNKDGCVNGADVSALVPSFLIIGPIPCLPVVSAMGVPTQRVQRVGGASLGLHPPSTSVQVDDIFTMDIVADAGVGSADTVDAYLDFDPTYLEVVDESGALATSIELNTDVFPSATFNTVDNATGQINFSATRFDSSLSGSFTTATIRFRVKAAAVDTTEVVFTRSGPRMSDLYLAGEPLNVTLANATVTNLATTTEVYLPLIKINRRRSHAN